MSSVSRAHESSGNVQWPFSPVKQACLKFTPVISHIMSVLLSTSDKRTGIETTSVLLKMKQIKHNS